MPSLLVNTARFTLLILALLLLSGCAQWELGRRHHNWQQQAQRIAESAMHAAARHDPHLNSADYADGWIAGYISVLYGKDPTTPLSPPNQFLDPKKTRPGDQQRFMLWQQGYQVGAESALACGSYSSTDLSTASPYPSSRLAPPVYTREQTPASAAPTHSLRPTETPEQTTSPPAPNRSVLPDTLPPVPPPGHEREREANPEPKNAPRSAPPAGNELTPRQDWRTAPPAQISEPQPNGKKPTETLRPEERPRLPTRSAPAVELSEPRRRTDSARSPIERQTDSDVDVSVPKDNDNNTSRPAEQVLPPAPAPQPQTSVTPSKPSATPDQTSPAEPQPRQVRPVPPRQPLVPSDPDDGLLTPEEVSSSFRNAYLRLYDAQSRMRSRATEIRRAAGPAAEPTYR